MANLSLDKTLCDLDAVSTLLESIRSRSSDQWLQKAEEWASKATHALEGLAIHYEDGDEAYKEPEEFRCFRLLDKHLELLVNTDDLQGLFKEKLSDPEIVELLMSFIDPSDNENWAIRVASQTGNVAVVRLLLKARDTSGRRVDPSVCNNYAIRYASSNGYDEVVELLLMDERVDPSADDDWAIKMASLNGHDNVVKRLLMDERVDPSAEQNWAIRYASFNGYVAVVKLLLMDKRVDPAAKQNWAIRNASMNGHQAVVELLKARGT